MNNIPFCGIKITGDNLISFIKEIDFYLKHDGQESIHITGVNPETVVHADSNPLVRDSIKNSYLVNIDNTFLYLTLKLLGKEVHGRVPTPDLFEAMLDLANQNNYSIYILGARLEILEKAISVIHKQYVNINIVGYNDGYYSDDTEWSIVNDIVRLKPQMIFLAFPSPRKELFIRNYKKLFISCVLLGIGGAIDVKAGLVKRAPFLLRKIGLEGIHRSFQNPLNYGLRYLKFYPKYIKIVIKDLL